MKTYLFGMTFSFIKVSLQAPDLRSFFKAPTAATSNYEKDLMQWKMVVAMVGGWLIGWAPYICYILSIMINKNSIDANPYSQKYAYVALPSILARISVVFRA